MTIPSPSTKYTTTISKSLARISQYPGNKSCADCRVPIIDLMGAFGSVSEPDNEDTESILSSFQLHHVRFAPSSNGTISTAESTEPPTRQYHRPSATSRPRLPQFGVVLCSFCAAAHKLVSICHVAALQDTSRWDAERVAILTDHGNHVSNPLLEHYYDPGATTTPRPTQKSDLATRVTFCRAKYQAMTFLLPTGGSSRAWRYLIQHKASPRHVEGLLSVISSDMTRAHSTGSRHLLNDATQTTTSVALPQRLVDFFCIVQASDVATNLNPNMLPKDVSNVALVPEVTSCFPLRPDDNDFPTHVGSFVTPSGGCRPSNTPRAPTFFTFVLTNADGSRSFGGVLTLYETTRDVQYLRRIHGIDDGDTTFLPEHDPDDVIYLPKSLVVLSHYPFFDLWRKFLLSLYRIALTEAPLPIERYVANFCAEVPLPSPGNIKVRYGFTLKDIWTIYRPPLNEFPLANFSFRPLFTCLSIPNVMTVFACLLSETPVALVSKYHSILTPVSEALVSSLFPFHWQGIYLPVMPYSMLEILEAPVPFLVGLHSQYLKDYPASQRPDGVVFVDLDKDCVHLGSLTSTPSLPERWANKLKVNLANSAASVYVLPDTGRAGVIMAGASEEHKLAYGERDSYAHLSPSEAPLSQQRRKEVLGNIDRAFRENELLQPITGFLSEQGQFYEGEAEHVASPEAAKTKPRTRRLFKRSKSNESIDDGRRDDPEHISIDKSILDLDDPPGFSTLETRRAFFGFFVSLFKNHRTFLINQSFDVDGFLAKLNLPDKSSGYVGEVLKTQMWSRFVEERLEDPNHPEVLFFDESINAKLNRSKKAALQNIGRGVTAKRDTSFIDGRQAVINTFAPPPPSNLGLPDDGRTYRYGLFPDMNPELYGKIRSPMTWPSEATRTDRSTVAAATERKLISMAMYPLMQSSQTFVKVTKTGARGLDTAIRNLSSPFSRKPTRRYGDKNGDSSHASSSNLDISDITMSAFLDGGSGVMEEAEEVVRNARRKQAVLVEYIVDIQAVTRMFLARRHYLIQLGRSEKTAEASPGVIATAANGSPESRRAAILVQSSFRGYRDRLTYEKTRALVLLLQALYRMMACRLRFLYVRHSTISLQALVRGASTRRRFRRVISGRMMLYRQHIFLLWQRSFAPLSYRCKFWSALLLEDCILNLVEAEREIQRMWHLLGVFPPVFSSRNSFQSDEILSLSNNLGLSIRFHWQCDEVDTQMVGQPMVSTATPSRKSLRRSEQGHLCRFESRLEAEKANIYEKIDTGLANDEVVEILDTLRIPAKVRHRKVVLCHTLFTKFDQMDDSTKVMMRLFPELAFSTDIIYKEPSKKSLKRLAVSSAVNYPLEQSLWAHIYLQTRVRDNLRYVASTALVALPRLLIEFDGLVSHEEAGARLREAFNRRLGNGLTSPEQRKQRTILLRSYLGRTSPLEESDTATTVSGQSSYPGDYFWLRN